jgi:hypothetical protein
LLKPYVMGCFNHAGVRGVSKSESSLFRRQCYAAALCTWRRRMRRLTILRW